MDIPAQKTIPFARDGQKNSLPTAGASTDEGASYQMGFPPRTMTDDATAVPPTGEDMNGILNDLSKASIYQQAGGFYPFNGTYAQAIGGYPVGALVLKSTFDGFWQNTVAGNMTNPDNGGAGWKSMSGSSSHAVNELVWAALPITDSGLHLLDGSALPAGGVNDEYVQYVAGIEATYPDAFCTEAEWQDSVTAYGACGKFVVARSGGSVVSVRLPKVSNILQGTTDLSAVGDLVEAGLPNITGVAYTGVTNPTPQTIKSLLYICVATTTKTDIEVDIDEVITDLNGKLDKSGGTMTGNLTLAYARTSDNDWKHTRAITSEYGEIDFTQSEDGTRLHTNIQHPTENKGFVFALENLLDGDRSSVESIVEQGINSNGSYVRYSNGLQICCGYLNINRTASAQSYSTNTWTYPKPFYMVNNSWANCRVLVNSRHDRFNVGTNNYSNTSAVIYNVNDSTTTTFTLGGVDLVVIGWWKAI